MSTDSPSPQEDTTVGAEAAIQGHIEGDNPLPAAIRGSPRSSIHDRAQYLLSQMDSSAVLSTASPPRDKSTHSSGGHESLPEATGIERRQSEAWTPHRFSQGNDNPYVPRRTASNVTSDVEGHNHDTSTPPVMHGATASRRKRPFDLPRTFFGLPRQHANQGQGGPSNEDYEQTFPEDAYGEEVGPNARVFRVYNEEAIRHDLDILGQSRDSSDVLLVFAGLFSAVQTTFVAQTSQALQTDNGVISNSLLSELVDLQRAQANGTALGNVERAITETKPSTIDLWVNGLWFTSLALSLATALFSVLTKQWLNKYIVSTSGTVRDRSLIRQFRFAGMQRWHVFTIIGILPILLHLALCVFLVGLVIFLIPRCLPLTYVIGGITIVVYSLYLITNFLPVWDIQCPYQTPFSEILNILHYQCRAAFISSQRYLYHMLSFTYTPLRWALPQIPHIDFLFPYNSVPRFKHLRDQENDRIHLTIASLSFDALSWLIDASLNPSVQSVVVQAVGGLAPSQREKAKRLTVNPSVLFPTLTKDCLEARLS